MSRVRCGDCGKWNDAEAEQCWLCNRPAPLGLAEGEPAAVMVAELVPAAPADRELPLGRTFSLSTLILVVTLIAVGLGIARVAPGVAVAFAIVIFPAVVRTALVVERFKRRNYRVWAADVVLLFFVSLGIIVATGASAATAFVVTCFPIGLVTFEATSGAGVLLAVAVGIAAGIAAGIAVWRGLAKRGE